MHHGLRTGVMCRIFVLIPNYQVLALRYALKCCISRPVSAKIPTPIRYQIARLLYPCRYRFEWAVSDRRYRGADVFRSFVESRELHVCRTATPEAYHWLNPVCGPTLPRNLPTVDVLCLSEMPDQRLQKDKKLASVAILSIHDNFRAGAR